MCLPSPEYRCNNFLEYLEKTFAKINKNKYDIFLMGDFNIDLLQYDSHNPTNDFINSMVSHSFLPYIHQPSRVTDHSATLSIIYFQTLLAINRKWKHYDSHC